jgi:hypothetical protein
VDEFLNTAIALLAETPSHPAAKPGRKSRLWDLRKDLTLGDLSVKDLIAEGRE